MKRSKLYKVVCLCMVWVFIFSVPARAEGVNADNSNWDNYESVLLPEDVKSSSMTVPWGQRGQYITLGTVTITNLENGVLGLFGSTDADVVCDKVKVKLYLDVKKNGTWVQCETWEFSDTNTYTINEYFETSDYSVGSYYRLRGTHSVTKGGKTETLSSATNAVLLTNR